MIVFSRSFAATLIGTISLGSLNANATEPNSENVACLSSVLRTAPNTISIKPAPDWLVNIPPDNFLRKGVSYTFRKPDGSMQTVGVYLTTEFGSRAPDHLPPNTVGPPILSAANNHRYALVLRQPYPANWYPVAREVFVPPNGKKYIQQNSTEHPLYGLWAELKAKCQIDNQELNSPEAP